jgi:hypothetical protein
MCEENYGERIVLFGGRRGYKDRYMDNLRIIKYVSSLFSVLGRTGAR